MANCDGCGSKWDNSQAAPVGSFAGNGSGLYDMVGNVWEWVEDCYHPGYQVETPQGKLDTPTDGSAWISGDCSRRVVRGGSWDNALVILRSANRSWSSTDDRLSHLGFRVGRTLLTP
jgi:formylglycine-generating enzyme required for sulfatase activity